MKMYSLPTPFEYCQSVPLFPSRIIIQMEELQKYELVESFLQSVKQAQSKQDFLSKVQDFDSRFIEDHSPPTVSEKQRSVEKLPPMPQEKPKNPFKNNLEDNPRHPNLAQTGQQFGPTPFAQQLPVRGNYRTEQHFYKGQPVLNPRTEQPAPNPRTEQPSYFPAQNQANQYSGGMAALNYNAYSQREYEQLKEQFFRPPMVRPLEGYNRMGEDVLNMGPMNMGLLGGSSSSDLLPGQTSFSKQTPRPSYPERVNPFMKQ